MADRDFPDFPPFPTVDGDPVPGWVEPRSIRLPMTALLVGSIALALLYGALFLATLLLIATPLYPGEPPDSQGVALASFATHFGGIWVVSALVLIVLGLIGLARARLR